MPTALFAVPTTIGLHEDLSDIITNISPLETPFISSIGRTQATGTLHEWQTITLAAAAANAAVEGASAAPASGQVTTRVQNRTQIFTKTVRVSNTLLAVQTAGRSNEWVFQMDLKAKELARDIERACIVQSAWVSADPSAETAQQMEGLCRDTPTAASANAGWASGCTVATVSAGSAWAGHASLTEIFFNDLLQTIWGNGGSPDTVHVAGYNRRVISTFSANATRMSSVDFGDTILNASVSVYQSDYGQVKVVLNRYVPIHAMFAIESQYFKLAELRPLTFTKIAKDGDRELGQYVCELTLAALAPLSSGQMITMASATGATGD